MNRLRYFLKQFVHRRKNWALNDINTKLDNYLIYKKGFYIELGANDGLKQSNTYHLESRMGWKGILIEPHEPNFQKLLENRSSKNHFINCACVSFAYSSQTYRYVYSDLMSIGLDDENDISDRIDHARQGLKFLDQSAINEIFTSTARTLDSILIETGAPAEIDFLSLDVEGAELSVLQGINHDSYKFKYILVESRNILDLGTYLKSKGYNLLESVSYHDYLFGYELD